MPTKLLTGIATRFGILRRSTVHTEAPEEGGGPKKRFKRLQLSLFSLLILICVVALIVQYAVVPTLRKRAREAMMQRIEKAGGQWAEIPAKSPDKRLLLSGKAVDDRLISDLAYQLRSFPELTQLDLFQTLVTDKGLEAITRARGQIKHMVVFENKISDEAIDEAQKRRSDLLIERRRPDPIAMGLAMAPIPKGAIVALLADSNRVLTGSGDGRMHRLDLTRQRPRQTFKLHDNWLFDLAISPDGMHLASVGGDNRLAIWKYPEMQLAGEVVAHNDDLHGVVWIDDGHLATVSDDRSLRTWQMKVKDTSFGSTCYELTLLQSHQEHRGAIPRIRLSEDRRTLITASRDDRLLVWHVGDNSAIELSGELIGHTDDCMDVRFEPNGKFAVSVGYDGKLIRWDLSTFRKIGEDQLDQGRLYCLEVDWSRGVAWVGTKSGIVEFEWEAKKLKATDDQPFVSRIVATDGNLISSDGFGSLISRRSNFGLNPTHYIALYEPPFDSYNGDYFEPSR